MLYRIVSESAAAALAAEGDGLIVSYDYRRKRKARLSVPVRERIVDLEGREAPSRHCVIAGKLVNRTMKVLL